MGNDLLTGLVDSGSVTATNSSFKEIMMDEYNPLADTKDWKRDNDNRLGKEWFDEFYKLLKKENIIPPMEGMVAGFDLLDISANNGSVPVYTADRLHKELLQQNLEPDNIKVHINDIVKELVESTMGSLNIGEYMLFGEKYSRNPLLCFSSQSAYKPDFNGQKFDVIMDLKGALWYAASKNKEGDDRKSVPEILDIYHNLLKMGGHIIIDSYELYAECTVNKMLSGNGNSGILKYENGNLELKPEYKEKFEIKQINGEHPNLRLVALKKIG